MQTPGRLLDLLQNGDLAPLLSSLQCLILDEADRLLDQGFRKDLEKIVTFLPDRTVIPRLVMAPVHGGRFSDFDQ
jgi:ATP-dependent RNA helicase MSS116